MTPEGHVKKAVKKVLHEYNVLPFVKALAALRSGKSIFGYYCMPSPTQFGESGIGDFLLNVQGNYLEVETKADTDPSPIQKAHGEVIAGTGGLYIVVKKVDTLHRLTDVLDKIKKDSGYQ